MYRNRQLDGIERQRYSGTDRHTDRDKDRYKGTEEKSDYGNERKYSIEIISAAPNLIIFSFCPFRR